MTRFNPSPALFYCRRTLGGLLCFAVLALPLQSVSAGTDEPLLAAVEAFLHQEVRHPGDTVAIAVMESPALLPACVDPQPFLPRPLRQQWGRVTVGVNCGSTTRSVRYMQAEISVIGSYLTLARQVPAGTAITADLLQIVSGDKSKLPPNTIFAADKAIGLQTRHQLAAGTVVQSQHLYRVPLVQSFQKVSVESQGGGFSISRSAEALGAGALGDTIKVRLNRQQTLDAVVTGPGRVAPL